MAEADRSIVENKRVFPPGNEALQAWLVMETAKRDTTIVSSISPTNWYAFGQSLSTDGVNVCAALVAKDFLAHINSIKSAKPELLTPMLNALKAQGITEVKIYGAAVDNPNDSSRILKRVTTALEEQGIKYKIILRPDINDSLSIVLKNGQMSVFNVHPNTSGDIDTISQVAKIQVDQ